MAGTLFGLGLMPQFDTTGALARGCLLYVYQANTSTPVVTYADFGLTSQQTWPIQGDSAGRLPQFWMADGSYRARLTTSAGVDIFDEQSITAIGASSGTGGGSSSQDTTTLIQTGDFIWTPVGTTRSGFVRANGLTIGSGASGGTERANADCQDLFEFLWTNYSDTDCPVSTGRGATATADFNANKTIGTFNMLDCVAIGRSGMGNTSTGLISDTAAASVGATTRTIAQANLPNVSFTVSGTAASHTHGVGSYAMGSSLSSSGSNTSIQEGSGVSHSNMRDGVSTVAAALTGTSAASGTLALTATAASGGSGTALSTIPKGRVGTWWIKL